MALGSMAAKLRKRHGRKIVINGDECFIRSPIMRELREVDELTKSAKNATDDEKEAVAKLSTAAWFGFVICEDAEGTLAFPRADGEDLKTWASRVQIELDEIENATLAGISEAVAKIRSLPSGEAVAKN